VKFSSLHALAATLLLLGGCAKGEQSQSVAQADPSLARVKRSGVLAWGADVVGGVPYVYEDSKHPGEYTGFEMEIAQSIARHLGVKLKLVVKAWDTLVPELQRGSFDMAMNGIEDTPERAKIVLFSDPYYVYSQQLTVRRETDGVQALADLQGKRVATLSGTAAEDILRATPRIKPVINPEITYSFQDLESGKVDAVLLDKPIAVAYGASNPKLKNVGDSFEEGRYIIAFRTEDRSLWEAVNQALAAMKSSGELKAIYERYGIMDHHQAQLGIR
jgi:polar amino acid transport system substrate-binding protein